jgi:hypothetical protein
VPAGGTALIGGDARRLRTAFRDTDATRGRYRVAVVAVACFSFVASYVVYRVFLPLGSGDLDEGIYVFQAHMLLHGLISLPASHYGEFFRPWLTGQRDGRIFTVYQIGMPAYLAFSQLVFGSMHVGLALLAALIIPATYGFTYELLGDRRIALTTAVFWALTPMFLLHSALLLSYPLSLLALTSAGWALLRGARTDGTWSLVAGGLLLGVVVLTRPFDVLPFGIPLAAFTVFRLRRPPAWSGGTSSGRWPASASGASRGWSVSRSGAVSGQRGVASAVARVAVLVGIGLVPSILVTLWFNWQATGSPWDFPNVTADPLNTFGFGARSLIVGQPVLDYNVHHALRALGTNVGAVPSWLFGGPVLIALALVGLVTVRRLPETVLLVVLSVAFPLAYFFWWATMLSATGAVNGVGPHYYLPSFIPVVILGAAGFTILVEHRGWLLTALALVVLVGVTAYAIPDKASDKLSVTHLYQHVQRAVPTGLHHALVFVHGPVDSSYILSNYPFLQTDPSLHGSVLYPADRGVLNAALIGEMSGRQAFLLRNQYEPGDRLLHPTAGLTPLDVVRGTALTVSIRPAALPAGHDVQSRAYLTVAGTTVFQPLVLEPDGRAAPARWTLVPTGSARSGPTVVPVPLTGAGTIVVGIETSTSPLYAVPEKTESRLPYRANPSGLTTVAPGVGWVLAQFPTRSAWLASDVSRRITVRVVPAPA